MCMLVCKYTLWDGGAVTVYPLQSINIAKNCYAKFGDAVPSLLLDVMSTCDIST